MVRTILVCMSMYALSCSAVSAAWFVGIQGIICESAQAVAAHYDRVGPYPTEADHKAKLSSSCNWREKMQIFRVVSIQFERQGTLVLMIGELQFGDSHKRHWAVISTKNIMELTEA